MAHTVSVKNRIGIFWTLSFWKIQIINNAEIHIFLTITTGVKNNFWSFSKVIMEEALIGT